MKARTGPKKKRRRLPPVAKGTWRPLLGPELSLTSPPDRTHLEQYMNESIQHWFRLEFLMEYDYKGNKLHCMMCTTTLSSLCLTDIKHHILDNHPTSLQFSPTQKSVILDAWINRKGGPQMGMEDLTREVEEDLTPEVEDDLTPDMEEEMTPEVEEDMEEEEEEEEEDDDEEEGDDDDDEEANKKFSEKVRSDVIQTTKLRPENRILKAKCSGDLMEKDLKSVQHLGEENNSSHSAQLMEEDNIEPTNSEHFTESEPTTGDVQLLDNEEWDKKEVHLLADEEWKARKKPLLESEQETRELQIAEEQQKAKGEEKHEAREGQFMEGEKKKTNESPLLKEERKTTERQLVKEQERIGEFELLKEEKQKLREAQLLEKSKSKAVQLLEEEKKDTKEAQLLEKEKTKAKEAELLEEEKRKAKEAQLPEAEKKAAMEAQLLEEEKRKAKAAQLLEEKNKKAKQAKLVEEKEAQLLAEEKSKPGDVQLQQERRVEVGKGLQEEKLKEQEGNLKEAQGLSKEVQCVAGEMLVKIEDHQYAEMPKNDKEEGQTANHAQAEKQQIHQKMVEGVRTQATEPGKPIIQVQQAPAVLGIGLPVLKMESPTPIIITRVSVLPEHTILQTSKSKPSTSTSDMSKTWRVIAPKVSPGDTQIPKPTPASSDSSQSPAGVDPTVWEVSVWRGNGNSANVVQTNGYQMRWRSDYLMDFNGVRGSVVCMYCSSSLTVLKESSIKRHIVQKHPHTGNFNAEERAAIILDWENKLSELKKMSANANKDGVITGDQALSLVKAPDCDPVEPEEEESSWSGVLPEGKGASWEFAFGRLQATVKDPRKYQHDRWKLEFLMDYTPAKDGLICMVCGATLMNPKISTVKMHIQQKHPDTTYLSDQEKAVVMEEWEQKMAVGKKAAGQQQGEDEICIEINEESTTSETNGSNVAASSPNPEIILPIFSKTPKSTPSLPPPCNSAKRNYQVRWRTEFMMDYDCRRQGLICMVCGGTLATLKVSTIKRHIVQVHPYSVDFTAEERQRILEAYSEMALHYIHSEECFKTQPQEEVKGRKRKATSLEES